MNYAVLNNLGSLTPHHFTTVPQVGRLVLLAQTLDVDAKMVIRIDLIQADIWI